MLGTRWAAPGKGATWAELTTAFGYIQGYPHVGAGNAHNRTDLALTGQPIQPYDRQRWESGNVTER